MKNIWLNNANVKITFWLEKRHWSSHETPCHFLVIFDIFFKHYVDSIGHHADRIHKRIRNNISYSILKKVIARGTHRHTCSTVQCAVEQKKRNPIECFIFRFMLLSLCVWTMCTWCKNHLKNRMSFDEAVKGPGTNTKNSIYVFVSFYLSNESFGRVFACDEQIHHSNILCSRIVGQRSKAFQTYRSGNMERKKPKLFYPNGHEQIIFSSSVFHRFFRFRFAVRPLSVQMIRQVSSKFYCWTWTHACICVCGFDELIQCIGQMVMRPSVDVC